MYVSFCHIPEKEELPPTGGVGWVSLREVGGHEGHEEAGEGAEAVADAHQGAAVGGRDVHDVHHGGNIAAVERVAWKFEKLEVMQ